MRQGMRSQSTRTFTASSCRKWAAAVAQRPSPLLFNVEVNFRSGAVFDYLLAVQFHL